MLDLSRIESERDWDDWSQVRNAVLPKRPLTGAELRFFGSLETHGLHLLARRGGSPVGGGFGGPLVGREGSDHGEIWIAVPPGLRRQGIGSALLARLQEHLRGLGKTAVQTETDSEDGLAYATRRGYREVGREQTVSLDLERWQPAGWRLPDQLALTDLAQRPDLLQAVWEVDRDASADIPAEEPDAGPSWEWFRQLLDKPGVDPA